MAWPAGFVGAQCRLSGNLPGLSASNKRIRCRFGSQKDSATVASWSTVVAGGLFHQTPGPPAPFRDEPSKYPKLRTWPAAL